MNTKNEKRIAFNKMNIQDAAGKLFKEKGITGTTVDDIAREAQYSKATIYVYFKSKEDIYYSIVFEYLKILHDGIRSCFDKQTTYESTYYELCYMLADFEEQYPLYFECILGNISVEEEQMKELPVLVDIFNLGERINEMVCDFLQRAKDDGYLRREINTLHTTFVMWSSICSVISMYHVKQSYLSTRLQMKRGEFLKESFSLILNMIKAED